jgi:hypothetical protein
LAVWIEHLHSLLSVGKHPALAVKWLS